MGKAASSAVNSDPRPRGHAPSAPHTLPRQVCSSPRALPMFSQHHSSHLSQDQGLASCTGRSFLQPGDAGAGSSSSLKHMPPAPTRSLELPLQHTPGTEFTLFAGSTPRPPPAPPASGRCLPRGTCRCGAELCLFPGLGQIPGQQACPAASAQHLFTGGGARDKLILFVVTSICPHPCPPVFCPAGHPGTLPAQPLLTDLTGPSPTLTPPPLPLPRGLQCPRGGAEAQLGMWCLSKGAESTPQAAFPGRKLAAVGRDWLGFLRKVAEDLELEPGIPGSCLVPLCQGPFCLPVLWSSMPRTTPLETFSPLPSHPWLTRDLG